MKSEHENHWNLFTPRWLLRCSYFWSVLTLTPQLNSTALGSYLLTCYVWPDIFSGRSTRQAFQGSVKSRCLVLHSIVSSRSHSQLAKSSRRKQYTFRDITSFYKTLPKHKTSSLILLSSVLFHDHYWEKLTLMSLIWLYHFICNPFIIQPNCVVVY